MQMSKRWFVENWNFKFKKILQVTQLLFAILLTTLKDIDTKCSVLQDNKKLRTVLFSAILHCKLQNFTIPRINRDLAIKCIYFF